MSYNFTFINAFQTLAHNQTRLVTYDMGFAHSPLETYKNQKTLLSYHFEGKVLSRVKAKLWLPVTLMISLPHLRLIIAGPEPVTLLIKLTQR